MNRRLVVLPESVHDLTEEIPNLDVTMVEEEIKNNHRPWSNLPADVLGDIMKLLSIADQFSLSCVCRNFRRLPLHHDRPVDRLPWLVTCHDSESDGFVCKLFDPLHKKPYSVDRITGPGLGWFRPDYVTSKDGWLFFLKEKDRLKDELFIFCPYTKEIIVLPDLEHGFWDTSEFYMDRGKRRRILTFSTSNPKSEECVFFAAYYLYDNKAHGKINICSYRHKEKEWKVTTKFHGPKFVKISNLLYSEGNLYFMNTKGCLGIYNVSSEKWSFFDSSPNVVYEHGRFSLVAYEGTILLALSNVPTVTSELYRLKEDSSSNKEWVPQEALENQALFLGYYPWECTILVPEELGDIEFVGNKIFYNSIEISNGYWSSRTEHWRFYDFIESEYLACDDTAFEYFIPRDEEKKGLIRPKNPLALWIDPPIQALKRLLD